MLHRSPPQLSRFAWRIILASLVVSLLGPVAVLAEGSNTLPVPCWLASVTITRPLHIHVAAGCSGGPRVLGPSLAATAALVRDSDGARLPLAFAGKFYLNVTVRVPTAGPWHVEFAAQTPTAQGVFVSQAFDIPPIDTSVAPTTAGVKPYWGATNTARTTRVTIPFTAPMTGVTGSAIRLVDPKGRTVSVVLTYDKTEWIATLRPVAALAARTKYRVVIATSVKNSRGLSVAADFRVFPFTTN